LVWFVMRIAPMNVKVFIVSIVAEKPLPVSIRLFEESYVEIVMLPVALKDLGFIIVLMIWMLSGFALEWSGSLKVILIYSVPARMQGYYE